MRKYISSLLLAISLIVGEIHTFWEGGAIRMQNWIYSVDRTMALQWNIKFASMQLQGILIAFAIYYFVKSKANTTAAASFVFFQFVDTYRYFYNYKLDGFGWAYIAAAVFGFLYYKLAFK